MPSVPTHITSTVLLSGQEAVSKQLEASTFNLVNADTGGFKSFVVETQEVPYKAKKGDQALSYTKPGEIKRNLTQGGISQTGNTFDVAIIGQGYFQVEGNKFTRNGRFSTDQTGRLITASGEAVLSDGGGEIIIDPTSKQVVITSDGTISTNKGVIGRLGVFNFADQTQMKYVGKGQYTTDVPPEADTQSRILQGSYENSNVEMVRELTTLIKLQEYFKEFQNVATRDEEQRKQLIRVSPKNT